MKKLIYTLLLLLVTFPAMAQSLLNNMNVFWPNRVPMYVIVRMES